MEKLAIVLIRSAVTEPDGPEILRPVGPLLGTRRRA
jgi:hypothetical protein